MDTTSDFKTFTRNLCADLIGVADLKPLRKGLPLFPENLIESYYYGLSIGVRLHDEVISDIIDRPTPEYAQHYQKIKCNAGSDICSGCPMDHGPRIPGNGHPGF